MSDWIADPEPHGTVRHEVRRQLDLVAAVGCTTNDERLSLDVPHADTAWARHRLKAIGIDLQQPWLLVHPGASAPSRRYPPELWVEALNLLAAELHCPIVFTGDAGESVLVRSIRRHVAHPSCSLAGKLDLGKFAAVIAQAPILLSNNTGPVHIAAAVGTPVVDLYALTNPQHTPWQVPSRVLYHDVSCSPCYKSVCPEGHHDCLGKVPPVRIARETVALLHDASGTDRIRKSHGRQASEPIVRDGDCIPPLQAARRAIAAENASRFEPLTPIVIHDARPQQEHRGQTHKPRRG